MNLSLIRSASDRTYWSFTMVLFTDIAFPFNSLLASPFELKNPVLAANASIIPSPSLRSPLVTVAWGTPAKLFWREGRITDYFVIYDKGN